MVPAEFEEKSYEAPLYNQLERGQPDIFTPGQVLESVLGFDRGMYLAESVLWQTLGYDIPPPGAALAYYHWPPFWGPPSPRKQLPRFRLNLFLQAKRPTYYTRKPRSLRSLVGINAPLWGFRITQHQQRLLEVLSATTHRRAHVAYAAAAFHTNLALFRHTRSRTIIENSTFPPVGVMSGHDAWYYQGPGGSGAANPKPEPIEQVPLIPRLRGLALATEPVRPGDFEWLHELASSVSETARSNEVADFQSAQFDDDFQTAERISEMYDLNPSLKAYVQVMLFVVRFNLNWLIVGDA